MNELGFALVGLTIGAVVALGILTVRRGPPAASATLEARLDAQSAEIRRLADASGVRDGAAEAPDEREECARELERVVARRAREVAQYLDPSLTAPVAVAAIPDAAYAVLRRAHADAFGRGVVIVPYSTALPVLLFLYSLAGRFGDAGDAQACLAEVAVLVDAIEGVLENKIAKAGTMISNGTEEMRSSLGKARASVARGRNPQVDAEPGEGILRAG